MSDAPYYSFCGPKALGVLAWIGPYAAASILSRIQRLRGDVTEPGTRTADALLALSWHGRAAERWRTERGRAEPVESAVEQDRRVRAAFRRDYSRPAREPRRNTAQAYLMSLPSTERSEIVEQRCAERASERFTVAEWLIGGSWLIVADASLRDGSFWPHFLVVEEGRVVTGDTPTADVFGDLAVTEAHRIVRRPRSLPAPDTLMDRSAAASIAGLGAAAQPRAASPAEPGPTKPLRNCAESCCGREGHGSAAAKFRDFSAALPPATSDRDQATARRTRGLNGASRPYTALTRER